MAASDLTVHADHAATHERSLLTREERRAANERRRRMLRIFTLRAGVLGGLLLLWWAVSGTHIDRLFISDPIAVVRSFIQISLDGTLWWHLERTLVEMSLGYV